MRRKGDEIFINLIFPVRFCFWHRDFRGGWIFENPGMKGCAVSVFMIDENGNWKPDTDEQMAMLRGQAGKNVTV